LTASGAATSIAAANIFTGAFPRAARVARPVAATLGLPLSTYTAALVSNTAVPVWHEAHRMLPFVFGSGAALSAGAVATAVTAPADAAPARRLALMGAALELGANEVMKQRLGPLAEPYETGPAARFRRASGACLLAGCVLIGARRRSRAAAAVGGALLCAGGLAARWAVFKAGFASAADPKYVIGPQRSAIERGERAGAARRLPRISEPQPALGSPATAPAVVREQEAVGAVPPRLAVAKEGPCGRFFRHGPGLATLARSVPSL
jgi:hypothetical protein